MPKRFSGDVKATVSYVLGDQYTVRVKAPGCGAHTGTTVLDDGYTELHGLDKAVDEVVRRHLQWMDADGEIHATKAAKDERGDFHVGREMADRWPGGPSNTKTKKGR